MQDWKSLLVLGLPLALVACGDKEIEEEDTTTEDTDVEDTSETVVENEPLEPVAVGFEFTGIWNESGADGAGSLDPYLFPDLNNENGGVPFALSQGVVITLASIEYFSLGSSATDEERAFETCSVFADFAYSPANLLAQGFDWDNSAGTSGNTVELWQSFEGTLNIRMDSASDRCAELADGNSLDQFDGMRFGIGFAPLSEYLRTDVLEPTQWWADDLEAQAAYFTQYIAINHPADTTLGYDFIAFDWTTSIMAEIDTEKCVDLESGEVVDADPESTTQLCGELKFVEEDDSFDYDWVDINENVGSRHVYVQGSAWWYEDYPNLDLSLMKEYPEQ